MNMMNSWLYSKYIPLLFFCKKNHLTKIFVQLSCCSKSKFMRKFVTRVLGYGVYSDTERNWQVVIWQWIAETERRWVEFRKSSNIEPIPGEWNSGTKNSNLHQGCDPTNSGQNSNTDAVGYRLFMWLAVEWNSWLNGRRKDAPTQEVCTSNFPCNSKFSSSVVQLNCK